MDEQRIQSHMALIEKLLSCPQGHEVAILQAREELVDAGLLEVMEKVVARLESRRNSSVDWLRGFIKELACGLPYPGVG